MKTEENVYEMNERTEVTAAVSRQGELEKSAPEQPVSVLGKFKDVDALARAYGSLQAEFTRRSQRLRELEKLTENFGQDGHSGAEKLRKNAQARRAETKRFEEFLSVNENSIDENAEAKPSGTEPVAEENMPEISAPSNEGNNENGGTVYALNPENAAAEQDSAFEKVTPNLTKETARGEANEVGRGDSGDLYEKVRGNEDVRLRIIGEYLSSIGKPNAPLMTGGVGTLTTPPVKANSISAAGDMALLYFKTPKCDS
jgi:hypothetical protein